MSEWAREFETLYAGSEDPWGFRDRWYERRKREIVCASLPRMEFESLWEIGCANGELTAMLASRTRRLLAIDGNARALTAARARVEEFPHVELREMWVPSSWPRSEQFDAIVFSEVGYYLTPSELDDFCGLIRTTLRPGGIFVACHWRAQIAGCTCVGEQVHDVLKRHFPWALVVRHLEEDFVLEIWDTAEGSVASREGLR